MQTCKNTKQFFDRTSNLKYKLINIFLILLCLILLPIVIVTSILMIKSLSKPTDIPSVFGYSPLIIKSDCMSPQINPGDLIVVKKLEDSEVQNGQIVSFKWNNFIITHRIVDIVTDESNVVKYRTKADNSCIADSKFIENPEILGVYKFKIPVMGEILLFLKSILGIIFISAVAALWIILLITL